MFTPRSLPMRLRLLRYYLISLFNNPDVPHRALLRRYLETCTLRMKNWGAAETVLKEVVASNKYSLVPNYADVFMTTNKNNSESVFEVQYRQGQDGYSSNFIYPWLPMPMTAPEITTAFANYGVAPTAIGAQTTEGYNVPSPEIIAAYEPGDERKAASIGTATAGGVDYPLIIKYLHPHTTAALTDDNFPSLSLR